jgi:hypothetical protein
MPVLARSCVKTTRILAQWTAVSVGTEGPIASPFRRPNVASRAARKGLTRALETRLWQRNYDKKVVLQGEFHTSAVL